MSAGVASGWPWAGWGRLGRQIDGLSHIFISSFSPRSCRRFLPPLRAANRRTVEPDCALGCNHLVGCPLVTALYCPLTPNNALHHEDSAFWGNFTALSDPKDSSSYGFGIKVIPTARINEDDSVASTVGVGGVVLTARQKYVARL
jgi:hypothetical protein